MNQSDLRSLLAPLELDGTNVMVHADPAVIGLADDCEGFCEALLEAVGPQGTIVLPTFTYAETLLQASGSAVPFHSDLPVSRELGPLPEVFRKLPGVLRSNHPSHSFAAWGRRAETVLSTQRDNNPLGPVKKLNILRGDALIIGVSLSACTAIHLAEETARFPYLGRATALRINASGYLERVVVEQVPGCSRAFAKLEPRIDPGVVRSAPLPQRGTARRLPIRYLVRLAAAALVDDPLFFTCEQSDCASCAAKRNAAGGRSNAA